MEDCIFCKIIKREIPSEIVYEDELVLAFKDINPAAPVHILLIPKKHIRDFTELEQEDASILGHLCLVAKQIAEEQGLAEHGYRLQNNCKDDGGQVIYHLHFHLLGGRKLSTSC